MLRNEIACKDRDRAMRIAGMLIDEEYAVMLSLEEDLTVVNFEYSENSDRNNVVFMSREAFDEEMFKDADDDSDEGYGCR